MQRYRLMKRVFERLLVAAIGLGTAATSTSGQLPPPTPQSTVRYQQEYLEGAALHADTQAEDRLMRQLRRPKAELGRLTAARRYAEAVPLQQRILEMVERERGRDRLWTLGEVRVLAELYQNLGRYDEAEALHQRMIEAHARMDGAGSDLTLVALNGLAIMYQSQGRSADAEQLYRRAFEASERQNGADHPSTIACAGNLATSLIAQGRSRDAEQYLIRALVASERRWGLYGSNTLTAANNLAVALQEQGRLPEAEVLFRRVLTSREAAYGPNGPGMRAARANLATLQQLMRERGQAAPGAPSSNGPAAAGPTCMVVSDIGIVDGQETRTPKQLCRTPPSMRWLRVS